MKHIFFFFTKKRAQTLPLMKATKALLIAMLLGMAGITKVVNGQALQQWELDENFLFYLLYDDVQALSTSMPNHWSSHAIREEQLPATENGIGYWSYDENLSSGWLGLAKNEREGFQVFYREHEKSRNLRVEVTSFLNAQGEELQHTLYYEQFFKVEGVLDDSVAEALLPYAGEPKVTMVNYNKMFYIELISTKDQRPGEYSATVSLYDEDGLLASKPVTAKVWNFALPEGHYAEVVMGLYNRNSGYGSTKSLFTFNGLQVDNAGNVAPEDKEEAKRILNGYQECLLEHGVSTYEIPRWLIDEDPKAAELTMADPRRKVFSVPVFYGDLYGSDFSQGAKQVLLQYKDLVYDNPFLKDKAFFYPKDEPTSPEHFAAIDQFCSTISNYWPDYHATVPFYNEYFPTIEAFGDNIDILCPSHSAFFPSNVNVAEERLQHFKNWPHKWWKPDNFNIGALECYIYGCVSGVMRRILFWQQYFVEGQGLLYWNCAFLPNTWQKNVLPLGSGIQNLNGDGILLYPGTMYGQDAATPIVSLRLKQMEAGVDDYDYMLLVDEFLGHSALMGKMDRALNIGYLDFPNKLYGMMNRHLDVFHSYSCHPTQISRWWFGKMLDEAANTEHDWGEWVTAVLPDETHDGLEIRTCSQCGTQESRPKTNIYRFLGTVDNQWSNLLNWEDTPESLPAVGEAVFIAHDCEIPANQLAEASSVKVKSGYSLTIKGGATLTSKLVTTENGAQVIIEDGGQLIHNNDGVTVTMEKNVAGYGNNDDGYVFISSPLTDDTDPADVDNLLSGDYDLYHFDAAATDGLEWRNYEANTFNMTNGTGYLYANQNNVKLSFTGTARGIHTPELVAPSFVENSVFNGLDLVGNPFTCNVYLNSANQNMAFYRMNANGNGYEAATDFIHPLEGFFVQSTNASQTFTIGREQVEGTRGELNIQIVQNVDNREAIGATDNAIIRFGNGSTLEKYSFFKQNAKLYIPMDGKNYAVINAENIGEISLNFEAKENGEYTLSVDPENVKMNYLHLVDNITGSDIDLLTTPSYTFEYQTSDNASRFRLVFSASIDAADER